MYHCEDVALRRCTTAEHCEVVALSNGALRISLVSQPTLLPISKEKRRATPTAQWKVQWREWQDWALLEPQTLQKLLTQSWKHGVSLVQYTWPVKGRGQSKPVKVQFEVDLAKLEVRNMKTNTRYPLQGSGPL